MKKTMTMMKKLAWLAVMALPLVTVGDIQQSLPWDENVMEPVILFDARDWRYWSVFAAVFIIVISLTIWIGKRWPDRFRSPSLGEYVVLEVLVGAAVASCIIYICMSSGGSFGLRERVVHHPAERPYHHPAARPDHLRISHPD